MTKEWLLATPISDGKICLFVRYARQNLHTLQTYQKTNICENLKPSLQNGNSLQKNKDLKWTRKATEVIFGRHIEYLPSRLTSMFWIFREVLLHTYYSVSGFHNCIESCQPCPAWMGLFKQGKSPLFLSAETKELTTYSGYGFFFFLFTSYLRLLISMHISFRDPKINSQNFY